MTKMFGFTNIWADGKDFNDRLWWHLYVQACRLLLILTLVIPM
jgi:hypothetical protein